MRKLMILLSLMLMSCMKTDIIGEVKMQMDTITMCKSHKPFTPRDVSEEDDTTRIQIEFNPTVMEFEKIDIIIKEE